MVLLLLYSRETASRYEERDLEKEMRKRKVFGKGKEKQGLEEDQKQKADLGEGRNLETKDRGALLFLCNPINGYK